MFSVKELTSTARARLKDAQSLLAAGRFDGAIYLSGYAVEIALKVRIAKTLKWTGFPSESKDFAGLTSFKTHDLDRLLYLCGWAAKIRGKVPAEWTNIRDWDPEVRYRPPGHVTRLDAESMLSDARSIMEALL